MPSVSFAGEHESYLNVRGEACILDAVRHCFASLFTDRAIRYRIDNGFDHFKVFISVGVMKMVRSDLAASGVIFTIDTETGFEDVRRAARRRALERGEADTIFQPFSKRLAPEFAEAVERFLAERKPRR